MSIKGFVGLKSKMYAFIKEGNHESKKANGINKKVVDDELKYKDYKKICSIDHIWDMKWIEFKEKIIM